MHICLRLLAMASNQTSDHVADEVEPRAMESNQSSDHVADEVEPRAMESNQSSDHVADEVEPRAMESNQSSDHVADEVEPQFIDAAKVATWEARPGAFQLLDKVTIEAGEVVKISEGRLWVAWLEMKFLEMEFLDPKDCLSLPLPPNFELPDTTTLRVGDYVKIFNGTERLWVVLKFVRPGDERLAGRIDNYRVGVESRGYGFSDLVRFRRQHVYDIIRYEDMMGHLV